MQVSVDKNYTTVLQTLIDQMQVHLGYFFEKIALEDIEGVLKEIQACRGTIFFIGVGKSGIIARKIAATMSSCGVRALYLSASDAPHGDIGVVQEGDLAICFSKSGETDELLYLLPALRNKRARIISVVANEKSRLAEQADFAVILPVAGELCPFDLAPTTSTIVQLIFGDLLAMALMRIQEMSLVEYAKNHPAGQIGRRITYKVSDIMLRNDALPLCTRDTRLMDVLVTLSEKRCGCILIINQNRCLEGIFTDGDLRRALQKYGAQLLEMPIEAVMTKNPRAVTSDVLAYDAVKMMEARPNAEITVLPVIESSGVVCGLVKLHDILQSGL